MNEKWAIVHDITKTRVWHNKLINKYCKQVFLINKVRCAVTGGWAEPKLKQRLANQSKEHMNRGSDKNVKTRG